MMQISGWLCNTDIFHSASQVQEAAPSSGTYTMSSENLFACILPASSSLDK